MALTVGELKQQLEEYKDEAEVWLDGCDCVGPGDRVEDDSDVIPKVLIMRVGH